MECSTCFAKGDIAFSISTKMQLFCRKHATRCVRCIYERKEGFPEDVSPLGFWWVCESCKSDKSSPFMQFLENLSAEMATLWVHNIEESPKHNQLQELYYWHIDTWIMKFAQKLSLWVIGNKEASKKTASFCHLLYDQRRISNRR